MYFFVLKFFFDRKMIGKFTVKFEISFLGLEIKHTFFVDGKIKSNYFFMIKIVVIYGTYF